MLRAPHLDTAMLEKLSVVLQRVSKLQYVERHTAVHDILCMVGGVGTVYGRVVLVQCMVGWCWYSVW